MQRTISDEGNFSKKKAFCAQPIFVPDGSSATDVNIAGVFEAINKGSFMSSLKLQAVADNYVDQGSTGQPKDSGRSGGKFAPQGWDPNANRR